MKRLLNLSLALLLLWIPQITNSQNNDDTDIDGYENISDALKHPNEAIRIGITGNTNEVKLLIDNYSSFKNLSAFKIKDASSEAEWDKLFVTLSKQPAIKEIELTFNEIKNVPGIISNFKNLEKLIIWGSPDLNYSNLFKNLSGLTNLKALELNGNEIENFPSELKQLKYLESFTITDNESINYADLIDKLSALPELKKLSLEVNGITELPPNIAKLKSLKKLNISNNYVTNLPDEMAKLANLDSLDVSGNLIVNYVDEFNKLRGIDINYFSVEKGLSEEEKAAILKLFPNSTLDEKTEDADQEPLTETTIQAAVLQNQLFKPIVPELNLPTSTFVINSNINSQIDLPSGTQIKIPNGTFVDKNNNPVNGNVTISYREFSNPFDIAFSGIPMEYSNDSMYYPMESAGMFEINAFQNNQPLSIKNGKEITIDLVSNDSSDSYNLYEIDTATKSWNDLGKRGTIKIAKPNSNNPADIVVPLISGQLTPTNYGFSENDIDSSAGNYRLSYQNGIILSNVWEQYRDLLRQYDTTSFDSRFTESSYCYLTKYFNNKYNRYLYLKIYTNKNIPIEKDECLFQIENLGHSNTNPELRTFDGIIWASEGSETLKAFQKKYIRNKKYSDIRIEKSDEKFVLKLKEKKGVISIPVHPFNNSKALPEKLQKNYDRRFRDYTKILTRRKKTFNKNLYCNYTKASPRQQKRFNINVYIYREQYCYKLWTNFKPKMNKKERKLDYRQWQRYYNSLCYAFPDSLAKLERNIKLNLTQKTLQSFNYLQGSISGKTQTYKKPVALRQISLVRLGMYNCDQPLSPSELFALQMPLIPKRAINGFLKAYNLTLRASSKIAETGNNITKVVSSINYPKAYSTIYANYTDKQSNKLTPTKVMLIDKRINAVADLGTGTSMTLAVNSTKNLFAVMGDGSVGLFSEDDFKKIDLLDRTNFTFALTMYPQKDLGKLREYLKY